MIDRNGKIEISCGYLEDQSVFPVGVVQPNDLVAQAYVIIKRCEKKGPFLISLFVS
jgi:hypothetical protein